MPCRLLNRLGFFSSCRSLSGGEDGIMYEIILDQRKLKTPRGNYFTVPNEFLAHAVAQEWDKQVGTIKRYNMYFTTLCNRVLDWQPYYEPADLVDEMMRFCDTDTICFRSSDPEEEKLQKECWDPVLNWIVNRYSVQPILTQSIMSATQMSPEHRELIRRYFLTYNKWGLIGFQSLVENLKSVFLALATVDGFCSPTRAVDLSQMEQSYQTARWREVLSYHDVDTAELKFRVSAATFLVLRSAYRRHVKCKSDGYFRQNFV